MIYDDLSIFILKTILENGEISTWDISKKYNWKDKPKFENHSDKDCFIRKKTSLIIDRIKNMVKEGFVKCETNGDNTKYYTVLTDIVIFKKHLFPDGYSDALLIKEAKGWIIMQI